MVGDGGLGHEADVPDKNPKKANFPDQLQNKCKGVDIEAALEQGFKTLDANSPFDHLENFFRNNGIAVIRNEITNAFGHTAHALLQHGLKYYEGDNERGCFQPPGTKTNIFNCSNKESLNSAIQTVFGIDKLIQVRDYNYLH